VSEAERQLEEALLPEEQGPQNFQVDTLEKAEWAIRKIARAEARIQAFIALAEKRKAEIDERLKEVTRADRLAVDQLGQLIRPWGEVEIAKAGKKKSMKLLGGEIGFRTTQHLEVIDEAAALASLENGHPECIRVKREVDKTATTKLIKEKGEVPDGVELASTTRFYIQAGDALLNPEAHAELPPDPPAAGGKPPAETATSAVPAGPGLNPPMTANERAAARAIDDRRKKEKGSPKDSVLDLFRPRRSKLTETGEREGGGEPTADEDPDGPNGLV